MERRVFISRRFMTDTRNGRLVTSICESLMEYFKIQNSWIYSITIVEGTKFFIKREKGLKGWEEVKDWYDIITDNKSIGFINDISFNKFFFIPDPNQKYDITFKKIKRI